MQIQPILALVALCFADIARLWPNRSTESSARVDGGWAPGQSPLFAVVSEAQHGSGDANGRAETDPICP